MLRISLVDSGNHGVVLRLEGRIAGPWVAEVRTACEALLAAGRSLKLDMAEVSFIDPEGVALLSSVTSQGVSLSECSPFVAEQLKAS